ncbi:MAG: hypothetical protein KDD50_03320 [Bdellovibrionales bacterium]|nr:hypothetical protein [Bdellovibrionales bacterium]
MQLRIVNWLFLAILFLCSSESFARSWKWGIIGGLGGMGISKTVTLEGEPVTASRSEEPGIFGVRFETQYSDRWAFSIEHRRGFRFGPFSMGVGFTDANWRWYFLSPPPILVANDVQSYIFENRMAYFLGFSTGIAFGEISREGDLIPRIESSGVTIGFRGGVDYPLNAKMFLRPEIIVSTTFLNSGSVASSMSEFGLVCGVLVPF